MDSQKYLESYGWQKGQPLKKGGLVKPILVSHKFDFKGVGHESKDTVAWWETIFDGQLKSLDVNKKGQFGVDTEKLKILENEERKKKSPLYQMFVKGEVLMGTVDKAGNRLVEPNKKRSICSITEDVETEQLVLFFSSDDEADRKRQKKEKKKKKVIKSRSEKHSTKDRKYKVKKEYKKQKKDKKDKKNKKHKKEKKQSSKKV
jgi:nucleolar protein TMA23